MIEYDKNKWWLISFAFRGTVLKRMLIRLALYQLLTVVLVILQHYKYPIPNVNSTIHTLLGTALGLLLVFRTNASYDRYWEGRKLWGVVFNTAKSIIMTASFCKRAGDGNPASELVPLLAAYSIALKEKLRGSTNVKELEAMISPASYAHVMERLKKHPNMPLASLFTITEWVSFRAEEGRLAPWQARVLSQYLGVLTDSQGGLERIAGTPVPFAYAAHTHQFLVLYLITLPFTLTVTYNYYALVAVFIVCFGLIGIDEAGVEIEDPFGNDANDLPLDAMCGKFMKDIQGLVTFTEGEDSKGKQINREETSHRDEINRNSNPNPNPNPLSAAMIQLDVESPSDNNGGY